MSNETTGVEGVSVRYAAQIRELLFDQAVKREAARIAAEREAARAALEPPPADPRPVADASRQTFETKPRNEPQTLPQPETRPTTPETAPEPVQAAPAPTPPGSRLNTYA